MRAILPALFSALIAPALVGCGTLTPHVRTLPERIETVHIPMPRSGSYEYGFQEELARALHDEFMADGRVRPTAEHLADAQLQTEITDFSRQTAAFNTDDYPLMEEMHLEATITLTEPGREDRPLIQSNLSAVEFANTDPRRTQFTPESEWREELVHSLAILIVEEVLTGVPDEAGEIETGDQPVDLDIPTERDFLSIRPSAQRD